MIKVKGRPAWFYWIADEHYDPAVHEIVRDEAIQETELEINATAEKANEEKP